MIINYNIEELESALSDFYEATGSAIVLIDSDLNTVINFKKPKNPFCELIQSTATGAKKCKCSDECLAKRCAESRKPEIHTCHAGLIDTAVPINYKDSVIGYIILGQMRSNTDFKDIYSRISDLGIDYKASERAYKNLPISTNDRIKSVSNTAAILTQYILFKNLITEQQSKALNDAVMYISANLDKDLSISELCKELNVSKNTLYGAFHKYMDCTVGEYINSKRIEFAKVLMLNSDKELRQISDASGFSDYTYFCKTFKKLTDTTPFKYRKSNLPK